jgi:hypothetical protein
MKKIITFNPLLNRKIYEVSGKDLRSFKNFVNLPGTMATFKVNQTFKITNRGEVLSGDIIDGKISPGDFVQLELDGLPIQLKIKSVEYIDHGKGYAEIGLMLGNIDDDVRDVLKSAAGKIIEISRG